MRLAARVVGFSLLLTGSVRSAPTQQQLIDYSVGNGAFSTTAYSLIAQTTTIPNSPSITWTGWVSTDWNTPGNWNLNRIPIAGDTVSIPAGTTADFTETLVGNIIVTGTLNWASGTMSGGTTTVAVGGVLNLSAHSAKYLINHTLVNRGTINVAASMLTAGGTTTISNQAGGVFALGGGVFVEWVNWHGEGALTFNNAGMLRKSGASSSSLAVHTLTNTGTIEVQEGPLSLSSVTFTTSNLVRVLAGGLSVVGGSGTFGGTFELSSGTSFGMSGGPWVLDPGLAFNGSGTYALEGNLVGTLTVAGTWNWSGGSMNGGTTTVEAGGVLNLSAYSSKYLINHTLVNNGTINLAAGALVADGTTTISNQAGGVFALEEGTVGMDYGEGALTFNNAGMLRKSGANPSGLSSLALTNTGTIEVQQGTLSLSSVACTQTAGSTLLSGGLLSLGPGLTLAGGALSGVGTVTGAVSNTAGQVAPGGTQIGRLTINGSYSQGAAGVLAIQLAGPAPGVDYDQLIVSGTASLSGSLSVNPTTGYVPPNGSTFTVLSFANRSGSFGEINGALASCATLNFTATTGVLTLGKISQTIAFSGPANQPFTTSSIPLSATATSGLMVGFSILSGPATLIGTSIVLTGTGTVAVRASQPGDTTYAAAPNVDRTFVVSANLASWQQSKFTPAELANPAVSGPAAVFGLDGLPNLVKYALGLEPKQNITGGLPDATAIGSEWVFTYTRPTSVIDVTYAVEVSTNLTTWSTVGVTHERVSTLNDLETWRGRYSLSAAPNAFFRLKVTQL